VIYLVSVVCVYLCISFVRYFVRSLRLSFCSVRDVFMYLHCVMYVGRYLFLCNFVVFLSLCMDVFSLCLGISLCAVLYAIM